MLSCFLSRIVILIFGTLYPAYASYKAVRTKNVKEYVKWMMYWIVFALFTCAETLTDLFLSFWFPFYYEIKIITLIYLLSPATKGSSILYRKFVHPVLIKKEQEIDEYIAKAKEQGYHTMLNLGSKGVNYATSLIMQTAIKGGGGLVNQLRKSYSLGDLSEDQHPRIRKGEFDDDVDGRYIEDPRYARSPRRTISNASDAGLYFPEVDAIQQPIGTDRSNLYGNIPSSEEISSGYSSGDPFYYDSQRSKGDHLARTVSLRETSRVRTRAATKTGLPKRSQLSEGGPTWSAVEPIGNQIEPDAYFQYPLSHSTSFPFHLGAFGNLIRPEYQQMLGNVPPGMFAFINHTQYSSLFRNNSSSGRMPESVGNENPSVVISEVKSDETVIEEKTPDEEKSNECEEKASDKKPQVERMGKYNKKPAPGPPTENSKNESSFENDDELEFRTPNSSPKPERKFSDTTTKSEDVPKPDEPKRSDLLEVPNKKSKIKKRNSQISKKLHLPKMNFSFWHPKPGKNSSESESSSIASVEVTATKPDDLEYYIPLKGSDEKTDVKEKKSD